MKGDQRGDYTTWYLASPKALLHRNLKLVSEKTKYFILSIESCHCPNVANCFSCQHACPCLCFRYISGKPPQEHLLHQTSDGTHMNNKLKNAVLISVHQISEFGMGDHHVEFSTIHVSLRCIRIASYFLSCFLAFFLSLFLYLMNLRSVVGSENELNMCQIIHHIIMYTPVLIWYRLF